MHMIQKCTTETVITILHKKVGVPADMDSIEHALWDDLGVDSLGLTETCMNLEHELGITIPHEEALRTQNVQELVALISSL